ncbi:MAG: class I SAM-dependent methyltransferase [Chloroflexi bacterium]|nr:class I SAM-dependent methyltransferase [Chloroflexota bacterium]
MSDADNVTGPLQEEQPPAPKLYGELVEWWPLLSPAEDYAEEAEFYRRVFESATDAPLRSLLELGSGAGSNASHLKAHFTMTLVEPAPGMLAHSRSLNPECEHVQGDMRTVRLGRTFDAVFVHDAIMYMTTEDDLRAALKTVRAHLRLGGVAVLAPDHTRETYRPETHHGGEDSPERSLRYLIWNWDPDPNDTMYVTDFTYVMRQADGSVRVEQDRHIFGLFPRETWLRLLRENGFVPHIVPLIHSEVEPGSSEVLVGVVMGSAPD